MIRCAAAIMLIAAACQAQFPDALPAIKVHSSGHFLQTQDGRPFFWLGDTAWELIDHTTREECSYYLHTRSMQGFTVIQTVVLSEFHGVTEPSALGEKPFIDNDPGHGRMKNISSVSGRSSTRRHPMVCMLHSFLVGEINLPLPGAMVHGCSGRTTCRLRTTTHAIWRKS